MYATAGRGPVEGGPRSSKGATEDPSSRGAGRRWRRMMAGLAFLLVLHAGLMPSYRQGPRRAYQRTCFGNQKTVAAAIEGYEADTGRRFTVLDDAVWGELVGRGYPPVRLVCPGRWYDPPGEYLLVRSPSDESPTIICTRHGCLQLVDHGSARSQAEALGVTDAAVRGRCTDQAPDGSHPWPLLDWLHEPQIVLVGPLAIVWVVFCLVAPRPALTPSSQPSR